MSVPALRFKQDDGIEFPKWGTKKIGDFVLSHKGGAPLKPADFVKNGNFEVIPKKAISSGGCLKLDEAEPTYCSEDFFEENQRSVVDKTFLITTLRDLVPSGPSIGYIVKYNNNKKYILAQGVYGIQIDENLIDDFLIQYSNTDKYRELMQTMMVGSTQVHIRNTDFFNTPFTVPCIKEQTKIANFLTAVDEKISLLTQKHDLLTQYKKGVMQKIFNQELRFKDDDGQDFSEWELRKIGDISVKVTAGATPSTLIKNYWGGEIRWMNSGELNLKKVFDVENRITELGLSKSSTKLIPPKCILIGLAGQGKTRGTVAMNMVELCTNQSIAAIHPNPEVFNEEYLYQNLDFRYEELRGLSTGDGGRGGLNLQIIKSMDVNLPSVYEQTKIANFLTAIDDKITATQTQLQAVKQYKQGLLQQMFV